MAMNSGLSDVACAPSQTHQRHRVVCISARRNVRRDRNQRLAIPGRWGPSEAPTSGVGGIGSGSGGGCGRRYRLRLHEITSDPVTALVFDRYWG